MNVHLINYMITIGYESEKTKNATNIFSKSSFYQYRLYQGRIIPFDHYLNGTAET